MAEQVGSRVRRSPVLWVALVAVALAAAIRLAGGIAGTSALWPVAIGIVAVAVIVVLVYALLDRSARGAVRRVSALRPGAPVHLTVPATELVETAARLGVDQRAVRPDGSRYTVVAVLPDRVEIWDRDGRQPLWSVPPPRGAGDVRVVLTRIGLSSMDALRIGSDGDQNALLVRPVPTPVWRDLSRRHRQAAMEQLVRDLGHDPAHVLV
ncbi:hypothetical protein ACFQHV_15925 [Promicromonospora thailandica]|uniref:Uncharacterized protein n=1 Tax=Promicromonospora thailandica TaxID=765201 RepID=A0A9X2G8M5_9MICO|nr:hypothetical protein [Promicromonospora thailandica]MCP2264656.1 hypothetical protein [Promicromonospora thailandica]BFF20266.1 hypothetical protein GCM10025730_37870 [Promicromonospora thailandica]